MNYAVCTVSTPEWTPEEAVAALRDLGFDGIEWRVADQPPGDGAPGFWAGNRCTWPFVTFEADAPRIRALTEAAGLAMPSIGTYARCDRPAEVERAMRAAAVLGAPQLRVILPPYEPDGSFLAHRARAREGFRAAAALAARYGVRALLEIHYGSLAPSASAAAALLDGLDPRHVGVIHDAGNMVFEEFEEYRLGLETLGPLLAHVHLKSAAWRPAGRRPDGSLAWEANWAPLRGGMVDVPALFAALRAVGYDGWVSFEDFSAEQPLREHLRDNLAYARGAERAAALPQAG